LPQATQVLQRFSIRMPLLFLASTAVNDLILKTVSRRVFFILSIRGYRFENSGMSMLHYLYCAAASNTILQAPESVTCVTIYHRRHYFFPPKIMNMFTSWLWSSQKSRDNFEDITELEFLSQFQKWFQVKIFDEDVLWSLKVGFLDYFFQHFTQHCFIWCPSDSTVSEDAVLNPRQLRYRHWLSMW
jgi:hypothetical protein